MLRRLGVLAVSVALVLLSLVPVPATANTGPPGGYVDGIVIGHGGKSTATGGTGPRGTTYTPPVTDIITNWYNLTAPQTWGPTPMPAPRAVTCKRRLADGKFAKGYSTFTRQTSSMGPGGVHTLKVRISWVGSKCDWGPDPKVTDVTCAVSVSIVGTGPEKNPAVRRGGTFFPLKTVKSSWASDRKDPAKCVSSVTQSAHVALTQLGQFTVTVTGLVVPCQRFDYEGQPAEIRNCGDSVPSPRDYQYQVWCNGWSKDHSGSHTFTMEECRTGDKKTWQCNKPSVKLGLSSSPVAVLDDGKVQNATWKKTTVSGAVKGPLRNQLSRVTVGPNSTPSRGAGVPQESIRQQYKAPDAGYAAGDKLTIPLQWYAPSMPNTSTMDRRWTLNRDVYFEADFAIPTVTITSLNLLTGNVDTPKPKLTYRPGDGICPSAPLVVTVNRAHNVR